MHQWIAQVLHLTIDVTETVILPFKNFSSSYQKHADTVASKNSAMAYLVSVVQWNSYWWKPQLQMQCVQLIHEISMRFIYIYIGFKTFFYVVRHLDSIASYLPTGLHLGFFRSLPSLYLPSSFSSVFLVLSFVSAST